MTFYAIIWLLSQPNPTAERGCAPLLFLAILPVIVTIVAYWICLPIGKWLDKHDKENRDN